MPHISISDFNHYFTELSRGIYTMIEVICSTVLRCFFAVEPVSVHNLLVGHKIDYCQYRTCFDLSKGWTKKLKFSQKQRSLTFLFATNNAIVGRTVSQHPVSTTVRKSRDYHQWYICKNSDEFEYFRNK